MNLRLLKLCAGKITTGSLTVILMTANACVPISRSRLESNSDSQGSGYSVSYDAMYDKYRNLPTSRLYSTEVVTWGKSVKGHDLFALQVRSRAQVTDPAKPLSSKQLFLITGAIHGNEYLGMEDKMPEEILQLAESSEPDIRKFWDSGSSIVFIPVINVDGYEYHRTTSDDAKQSEGGPDGGNSWGRMNANKKDLNRDFTILDQKVGFTQPESAALDAFLTAQTQAGYKIKFSIDFHCCMENGVLLTPFGFSRKLDQTQQQMYDPFIKIVRDELKDQDGGIAVGPAKEMAGYEALGVTADNFVLSRNTVAFMFEGKYKGELNRQSKLSSAVIKSMKLAVADVVSLPVTYPAVNNSVPVLNENIFVAMSEGAPNQVSFVVAAPKIQIARICSGNAAVCLLPDAKISATVNLDTTRGGINFMLPVPAQEVGNTQELSSTIICEGPTGVVSYRVVKFLRK